MSIGHGYFDHLVMRCDDGEINNRKANRRNNKLHNGLYIACDWLMALIDSNQMTLSGAQQRRGTGKIATLIRLMRVANEQRDDHELTNMDIGDGYSSWM